MFTLTYLPYLFSADYKEDYTISDKRFTDKNISQLTYFFILVRFEVFTAVTMKNGVFWVLTPCGSLQEPHGVTTQKTPFFFILVR
jgi:hypothetical protein